MADVFDLERFLNVRSAWGATFSPDEQFVAWTERYHAYVMPFARSGRSIDIASRRMLT